MELFKFFRCGADDASSPESRKWRLISVTKSLKELIEEFGNVDLFLSVQTYTSNQINANGDTYSLVETDCPYLAPLFFDMDFEGNPDVARIDTKRLVDYLHTDMQVPLRCIKVYFSGKKGFHVVIDFQDLCFKPRNDWHLIYKNFAKDIIRIMKLQSLDLNVYSKRRVLRVTGSVNGKTNRYKIPLTYEELDLPLDKIQDLAKAPREEVTRPMDEEPSESCTILSAILNEYIKQRALEEINQRITPPEFVAEAIRTNPVPDCINDLLARGIWKAGDRNHALMALATYFKMAGKPLADTCDMLVKWSREIPYSLTSTHGHLLDTNTRSVVESIYSTKEHTFKCPFVLSLGTSDDRVKCVKTSCPLSEQNLLRNLPAEEIDLFDATNAEFTTRKVKTKVLISVIPEAPFLIPTRYRCTCVGSADCKKKCQLESSGPMEKVLTCADFEVIKLASVPKEQHRSILTKNLYNANCQKCIVEELEYSNFWDIEVTSAFSNSVSLYGTGIDISKQTKNVTICAYFMGAKLPEINGIYTITGYLFPFPKDNKAILIIEKFETEGTEIEKFALTSEVAESFNLFKQTPQEEADDSGEATYKKLMQISDTIATETIGINSRNEVVLGILLVYHSLLFINFLGQIKKGWMEVLIIGDSGEGKSTAVRGLMHYIGLGSFVAGESCGRTGLSYALDRNRDRWLVRWGEMVRQDKKIVHVDEASGVKPEDWDQLTECRSSGVLKVKRIVNAETLCRVRLIMTTNPKNNKHIERFDYPISAVNQLFSSPADVRRLCFAIIVAKNDVSLEKMNQMKRIEPDESKRMYSAKLLSDSVLFSWSRTPDQVLFTPEAESAVLSVASALWKRYQHETIELISKGDTKDKVARISTAMAALLKSTDETGKVIVVKPCHARAVYIYLKELYDAYGLAEASHKYQNLNFDAELPREASESKLAYDLRKGKAAFDFLYNLACKKLNNDKEVVKILMDTMQNMDTYSVTDLISCTNLERRDMGSFLSELLKYNYIQYRNNDKYVGTPKIKLAFRFMINDQLKKKMEQSDETASGIGKIDPVVMEEPVNPYSDKGLDTGDTDKFGLTVLKKR